MQWKNALVYLKKSSLLWMYVDSEDIQQMDLHQIKSIDLNKRAWNIICKSGEMHSFKCATAKEAEEWVDEVSGEADLDEREINVK